MHPWANSEELLALIAELVSENNRMYLQAHGVTPGEPLRIPRPSVVRRPPASAEQMHEFFSRGAR